MNSSLEAIREPKVPKTTSAATFLRTELAKRRIDLHNTPPKFSQPMFLQMNFDPEWPRAKRRKKRLSWFAKRRATSIT
jgi:hypothetical protein